MRERIERESEREYVFMSTYVYVCGAFLRARVCAGARMCIPLFCENKPQLQAQVCTNVTTDSLNHCYAMRIKAVRQYLPRLCYNICRFYRAL